MIKELMSVFAGLQRAHGVYNVKGEKKKGKVSGDAWTEMEPVTEELWQQHIDGKKGLGIVPIRDDATCVFGAIDIDVYPLDLEELEQKIKELDLPLIPCRTKSAGAHLWLFGAEAITAKLMRETLLEWSIALGYSGCEIFPKQEQLAEGGKDVGNWINMPYFDAQRTERYAVRDGKKLTLKQFLNYVKKKQITAADLSKISALAENGLEGGPPCLQFLTAQGVPQGTRNTIMFNLAVYTRHRYGEQWVQYVEELNQAHMSPPLAQKELQVILKSAGKKEYFYTCKQEPLCGSCNKEVCKQREYGIGYGMDDVAVVELGELTKIMTDPPIWIIDINGVRVELASDDLLRQDRFRKVCMERINFLPPRVKAKSWEEMINQRLETCQLVEAPEDTGAAGMFWHYLRQFCTGPAQAATKDEILTGKVWANNGHIYFRAVDLMTYLDRNRFKLLDQRRIWSLIRESGAGYSTFNLKGVKTKVWYVNQFEEQTEGFDVPQTEQRI